MEKVKITQVKPNDSNPRYIKDVKFEKLVESVKKFPEMLQARPIVVNKDMVVLGGNMRLRACKEAGLKEVFIEQVNWSEEKQREFIIKDNASFGEWDWDVLANEWDNQALLDWGLDVWVPENDIELDDFFSQENSEGKESPDVIMLKYTQQEHDIVKDALLKIASTPEQAVWSLLGLKE